MVRSEIDKDPRNVQAREHLARISGRTCRRKRKTKKKNSTGQKKSRSFTIARELRGIYHFDPEDLVFNENHEELHERTLELLMDSAMPCKLRKTSGNSSVGGAQGPTREVAICIGMDWFFAKTTRENCLRMNVRGSGINQKAHSRDSEQRT